MLRKHMAIQSTGQTFMNPCVASLPSCGDASNESGDKYPRPRRRHPRRGAARAHDGDMRDHEISFAQLSSGPAQVEVKFIALYSFLYCKYIVLQNKDTKAT